MTDRYYENETFDALCLTAETLENYQCIDCTFTNCVLDGCTLRRCAFSSCRFEHCRVNDLTSENSQMKYSEFTDCALTGINWATLLPDGRFAEPVSRFEACRLKYNTFTGMNLPKFNFTGTELLSSLFAECQLPDSNFKGCKLDDTEFFKSDLRKADFRNATGYQVDILNCKLKAAKFSFPDAMNLLRALEIKLD